jgi:hypothetical protein
MMAWIEAGAIVGGMLLICLLTVRVLKRMVRRPLSEYADDVYCEGYRAGWQDCASALGPSELTDDERLELARVRQEMGDARDSKSDLSQGA